MSDSVSRPASRTPFLGVRNIVRFNYHLFVIAALTIVCFVLIGMSTTVAWVQAVAISIAALTFLSTVNSLVVSWWVYDHSPLYSLQWLDSTLSGCTGPVLNIHAGFDETSRLLKERFAFTDMRVLDFYDPARHTERSIRRARAVSEPYPGTERVSALHLGLCPSSIQIVFLILAIHEIRDSEERVRCLRQIREALRPDGKVIVVEHARDVANFIAYGVGFYHFLSPKVLRGSFSEAGLRIATERRLTSFLRVFELVPE